MKVLVTGAHGQVGRALIASAPAETEVVAVGHADLDIGDAAAVDRLLGELQPGIVVNAAAYTAVDRAESEPEQARRVNEAGPANLARATGRLGARLLHLSTDFVFDGLGSERYQPDAATAPLSVYGATKLGGEQAVRAILPTQSVVLRTAWVYDARGRNFLLTMLRLMRERGSVRVVSDQVGTPTAAHSVALALWALVARPALSGIHHWTDAGVATWYDFAVAIAEEWAARVGASQPAQVIPIGTADYPTPALRPRFSVLDCTATHAALELSPRHWRQNLRTVVGEIPLA
jgi:dTDP-4-dehydrorhamnose reductase